MTNSVGPDVDYRIKKFACCFVQNAKSGPDEQLETKKLRHAAAMLGVADVDAYVEAEFASFQSVIAGDANPPLHPGDSRPPSESPRCRP